MTIWKSSETGLASSKHPSPFSSINIFSDLLSSSSFFVNRGSRSSFAMLSIAFSRYSMVGFSSHRLGKLEDVQLVACGGVVVHNQPDSAAREKRVEVSFLLTTLYLVDHHQ